MIARLNLVPGTKLLDVATGTGVVAMAAAQAVGEQGRVVAIDLAEAMLDRLQEKIANFGIRNIDLCVMEAGLREWARVLKPGGRVMFSVFGERSFQPMMERLIRRLEQHGVVTNNDPSACALKRLPDPSRLRNAIHLEPDTWLKKGCGWTWKPFCRWHKTLKAIRS